MDGWMDGWIDTYKLVSRDGGKQLPSISWFQSPKLLELGTFGVCTILKILRGQIYGCVKNGLRCLLHRAIIMVNLSLNKDVIMPTKNTR